MAYTKKSSSEDEGITVVKRRREPIVEQPVPVPEPVKEVVKEPVKTVNPEVKAIIESLPVAPFISKVEDALKFVDEYNRCLEQLKTKYLK